MTDKLYNPVLLGRKAAVLIDEDNLTIGAQGKIDYRKLLEKVGVRDIRRALLYRPAAKQKPFPPDFQSVLKNKFHIEVKTPPKNVDSWLIVDAMAMAAEFEVIALVAGDVDYVPLVRNLQKRGLWVEVLSWPNKAAPALKQAANLYIPLDASILLDRAA